MALIVDIQKKYGPFQLNVALTAADGITGLLGASGAGKSLALKCIAGIITPDAGYIELDGRVLFDSRKRINLPPQRRHIGYLFQHYALFPQMTTEQNIAAGLRGRRKNAQIVDALISALRLDDCRGKYPSQLSGGQQQRVALARILASEPAALLLDEPFSALDSYLKWQVELELTERLAQFSGPVLFVTHDRDEIYRLCRQVCVLVGGNAQPMQTVQALFEQPATLSACRLSGCENFSRVHANEDGTVEALDWGLRLEAAALPENISFLGIRAQHLRPADGPGPNRVCCRVLQRIEGRLADTLLLATPAGDRDAAVLRMELEKSKLPPGGFPKELWAELPAKDLMPLSGE